MRHENEAAFTLIELVLAVALIGGSFLTLLYLRTSAVDRAYLYNRDRDVQRLAQEKLDEVVFGLEEDSDGSFEDHGPRFQAHHWSVEAMLVGSGDPELLECRITVFYPDGREQEGEYTLSTWFFPDEEHPLLESIDRPSTEVGL